MFAGFLEPEGELERSYKARQDFLKEELPVETARKGFSLKLEGLGPYLVDYTCTGRSMLLAGRKGHVAAIRDWRTGELGSEMQLNETVCDICSAVQTGSAEASESRFLMQSFFTTTPFSP